NRHNAEDGTYIDTFASVAGGPTRMAIGADGLIYVLQWTGNGPVLRFDQNGNFVDEFTEIGVNQSIGMAWDGEGRLYVSSYGGDSVQRFNTDGTHDGAFISSGLVGPTNIWFEEDGNLLVSDYNAGNIKRFDSEGEYLGVFITSLSQPEGIAYLSNGDLLVGNGGTGEVKRFDDEGEFIGDFIPAGTTPGLVTPNAVVIRDITTSVERGFYENLNFIAPTIGQAFYASSEMAAEVISVSVFSATGQHIVTRSVSDRLIWDASSYPEGLYVVNATLQNGSVGRKKVLVQNN
ncbi:MAG: T9SS type A sorting domain-containing protein, partial [Cryomorphaceae bacterium]